MPLYEVKHAIPLTISQKDDLALAITDIHSTKFTTPKLFVNVTYTDVSTTRTYIAGKPRSGNHILATVRAGPSRTQQDWDDASRQVAKAWDGIVGVGLPKVKRGTPDPDTSLRSVIFVGGMLGGLEAGFVLPAAGQDVKWLQENWGAFKQKAEEGDEDFRDMVKDVEERRLLEMNGSNGVSPEEMKRRLEEELGWGDSA